MTLGTAWLALALLSASAGSGATMTDSTSLLHALTPQPQRLDMGHGHLRTAGARLAVSWAAGREHAACRSVLREALELAGAELVRPVDSAEPLAFAIGAGAMS